MLFRSAGVLVQPHSVQLLPTRESLVDALRLHLGAESQASVKFQKQLDATGASTAPAFRVIYIGTVTDGDDPERTIVHYHVADPARLRRMGGNQVGREGTQGTQQFAPGQVGGGLAGAQGGAGEGAHAAQHGALHQLGTAGRVGADQARVHQWDGKAWKIISDMYTADRGLLDPLVKENSAKYAAEKKIEPRDCAKVN